MTPTTTPSPAVSRTPGTLPPTIDTLVVGSGFGGLAAAIKLGEAGIEYLVIERGSDVGGTWRDNTYPGAACDVPSHLYSFSFDLNPDWSRSFSPQPEIYAYLKRVARKHGVLEHHVFDCTLTAARWDAATGRWIVQTTKGEISARVLIGAFGGLAEPALPDIPGIETFAGAVFHSARWDHDADLTGKRVAVIGTGASAVQLVPRVAEQVAHLDVYQRTAPWVIPRHDRPYSKPEHWAFRHVPGFQKAMRSAIYWGRETYAFAFVGHTGLLNPVEKVAKLHINKGIKDPALRRAVTPTWQLGCKRILISNEWYPALDRPDVELVTDGIAEIRPEGIVDRSGTLREVDVIINATGFHVTDSPTYQLITGADGRTLADQWEETGQSAYKGTTVEGYPNFFMIVGPNVGLGHTSMVFMIESQVNYIVDGLKAMRSDGVDAVEVRGDVQRTFNSGLQQTMKSTVWTTGGCSSWYLDKHGNNTILWPGYTFRFRALTRQFDMSAYRSVPAGAPAPELEQVS